MEFAVTVEGLTKQDQALWVLAVEGSRLLVVHPDQTMHWHPIEKCRFVKAVDPLAPKPVVPVAPPEPQITKASKLEVIGGRGLA